jgi:predicted aspartyl protease
MLLRHFTLLLSCIFVPLEGADSRPINPALVGALRSSALPAATKSVILPIKSTIEGFIVDVQIDGKLVQLVLDTGATCTVLSPKTAQHLGLRAEVWDENVTSATGGRLVTRRAVTRNIRLGAAWTVNEPVLVSGMIPGIDGLLGVSTLADWDVRIDPTTKKLILFPSGKAPPLEGETVLALTCLVVDPEASRFNRQGFRGMYLRAPVRVNDHELMADLDTGYGGTFKLPDVLMEKFAPKALREARPGQITELNLSGKTVTRRAKLPEFTFGPDTLRGLTVEVQEAVPCSIAEFAGVIGLNLLRHYVMTLRFAAGELRLKPIGTVQEITRSSTVGIHFELDGRILSVDPAGLAARVGLRAGDEVLEIGGYEWKNITLEELAALKALPPGSVIHVRYRRGKSSPVETRLLVVKE